MCVAAMCRRPQAVAVSDVMLVVLQVLLLVQVRLMRRLVVVATEHGLVPHAELVAFRQRRIADGAREAAYVEDKMSGTHHQLRRADRCHAA